MEKQSVLIIDDEVKAVALLKRALEDEGYRVLSAQTGYEGIVIAEDEKPGTVILDIRMPSMDGWGVLKHIKENPVTSAIPVIILSAYSQERDKEKADKMGAYHYMVKPVEIDKLIAFLSLARG